MKLPGINTMRSELRLLESFRHTRYKNRTLKYNTKLIKYRGTISRFENSKIVCGDQVFVQDPQSCIFATQDLKDFKILGMGEIIGAAGSFLIFKRKSLYHIFSNGIMVVLHFYLENDKLLYGPAQSEALADVLQRALVHRGYFVAQSERNILFINLRDNTDVQFKFPGKILKMKRITVGKVEYIFLRYVRGMMCVECDALFYHNQLVSQSAKTIKQGGQYVAEAAQTIDGQIINQESTFQYFRRGNLECCAPNLQFSTEVGQVTEKTGDIESCMDHKEDIRATFLNRDAQASRCSELALQHSFLNKLVVYHHGLNNTPYEPDNQRNTAGKSAPPGLSHNPTGETADGIKVLGSFSPLEKRLFKYLSLDEQVLFLKSRVEGKSYDIVAKLLGTLIHQFEGVESLATRENMDRHGHILSALRIHDFKTFFYQNPDLDVLLKGECFQFRQPFTEKELEFLGRKYSRIFRFSPEARGSKNLAYSIASYESRHEQDTLDQAHMLSSISSTKKLFNRLFKSYFGDIRIQDIVQLMLEGSIAIQADVNDVNNFRQNTFILRSYSNIGSFILNPDGVYRDSYFKEVPKINNNRIDDKVSPDFMFLNGACLSMFYKESNMGAHYDLGVAFGNGLSRGLADEDTQQYLKMIEDADEKMLKYLLLIVSTRSINDSSKRSININNVLKAQIENPSMDLRRAALCALAIYNHNTNDRNILEILAGECKRFGPVNLEKNSCFYDRNHRMLAALCCGLVATKPISAALDDSFCELLINGLSSVDSGCPKELFYRTDDCRPQEIFYSQLFELTCEFSVSIDSVIQSISFESTWSTLEIFRTSAKVFYISLKSLRDQPGTCVHDWLFNLAEKTEEMLEESPGIQILFDTALVALSIVKNGTCDLNLLRMLRRQILKTRDLKHMKDYAFFDQAKKNRAVFKGWGYESMQTYKICVGMVCSNFGMSKMKADIKQLIVTFFISSNLPFQFSHLDILRMLIVKSLVPNQQVLEALKDRATEIDLRDKRKHLSKLFKSKFPKLNMLDKKVVVDILSDYYENYHFSKKDWAIFDLRILARLVSICK